MRNIIFVPVTEGHIQVYREDDNYVRLRITNRKVTPLGVNKSKVKKNQERDRWVSFKTFEDFDNFKKAINNIEAI